MIKHLITKYLGRFAGICMSVLLASGLGAAPALADDLVPPLTSCVGAQRGISSFACDTSDPATPSGWIIGTAPALSCWAGAAPTCSGSQVFNCNTGACQCNTASFPCAGCTAGSVTPGAACASPTGGVYSNSCNTSCACPANTTNCSNVCVSSVCPAGTTFSCGGGCSTPYVLLSPPSQQSGDINVSGDITAGAGNLRLDSATANGTGDVYLATGKAVLVNSAGNSSLVVGNWHASATGFGLYVRGPIYGQSGLGSGMALQVGDDAGIYDINWGNGIAIRGLGNPAVGGLSLGSGGGSLWGGNGGIAINSTSPTTGVPLTIYNSSGASASKATIVMDGTVAVGQSFAGLRMKHNIFTTGWGGDILAYDQGSFGTNLVFRVTPTGSTNATTPTERLRLASTGMLGVGSRSASVGYPLDVASTTGTAIARLSDDSASGNLWTGLRLDRGFGTEQWFFGMNGTNGDLRIRKDGATDVIRVSDTDGSVTINNNFTVASDGSVTFGGSGGGALFCSGPQYVAMTGSAVNGASAVSYAGANALCAAASPGSHVCTPDEIMRSISCGAALPSAVSLWVNNGAPGFVTPSANDCVGWSNATTSYYGAVWNFNGATGGSANATGCNQTYRYSCCR